MTGRGKDGAPREVYVYHVADNAWTMREYGTQAVVWQTALGPSVALIGGIVAENRDSVDELVSGLALYSVTVIVGLLIHALIVLPLILKFLGKKSPGRYFANMGQALATAFTTASSSATATTAPTRVTTRPKAAAHSKIEETAFRNSTLQGAYFLLAARAIGLDCGPMSGFDRARLDAVFFPDGKIRSNFICALGYADHEKLFPRGPRLDFDEACRLL